MAEEQGFFPRQVILDAYGNGGFRFADLSHRGSLLCLPNGMHGWDVTRTSDLTLASLAPVLAQAEDVDVLLIGLGDDISALPAGMRQALRDAKIIVEAIATGGAVRTYNVLMQEKRAVAAALIAVEHAGR